jgi:hypothetical protein
MPGTRLERVEKLAGAGMWIANGVALFLALTYRTEWTAVASGCLVALTVVNAAAGIRRRPAGQRLGATRLERVEKLAVTGVWVISGVALYLASTGTDWTFVPSGFVLALSAVTAAAVIQRRLAGQRLELEKGSGRSGHGHHDGGGGVGGAGRDDDAGPATETVYRRRSLAAVSRLMPASAGRRWLAEAESVLAEVPPALRGATVRSYLRSAPRLAVMMWARQVLRRLRFGPRRPG